MSLQVAACLRCARSGGGTNKEGGSEAAKESEQAGAQRG